MTETSESSSKKAPQRSSEGSRPSKKSSSSSQDEGSSPRKKSSSSSQDEGGTPRRSAPRSQARPPAKPSKVAAEVMSELGALTGKDVEGVAGLEKTDDGWTVRVEVVELRRIPDTTDVLALYEVQADTHGSLEGYQRVRRYVRGVPDND